MDIKELDKSNLHKLIIDYPNQLNIGQQFAKGVSVPQKNYSNLIICGMGGSAIPGEMLISYLIHKTKSPLRIPSYLVRGYSLPPIANSDSLIFISSYSGGTEETLACFKDALKIGATIVTFSAGGKIEELAKEYGLAHVKLTIDIDNFQPRYATTYSFAAMQQVLTNSSLCDTLERIPSLDALQFEKKGISLAKQAVGKIPIIYASSGFKFLAKLWKIKLNENSDTQAFWNYFPELNHNELEGFSRPQAQFKVVILRSKDDPKRISERMELTNQFYQSWDIDCEIIDLVGESYLEQFINGMLLGDWYSYYLAMEYGIDPTPSDVVEEFKSKLS